MPRAPGPIPRILERSWHVTLAFVALSIVALAAGPVYTNIRVREVRAEFAAHLDPARTLVGGIQESFAMQLLAVGEVAQGEVAAGAARYHAAVDEELARERVLDSLLTPFGPELALGFADFRTRAVDWHLRVEPLIDSIVADSAVALRRLAAVRADSLATLARDAAGALHALRTFGRQLDGLAAQRRAEIERMEELDLRLPAFLLPFAVASVLVVVWVGRRIVSLAGEAEAARSALAESTAARTALVRGITHDLKNPLGAARGFAVLMDEGLDGPLTDRQRHTVGRIRALIDGALVIIRDVVHLSDATAPDLALDRAPVDLAPLVADTVADWTAAALQAGLTLRLDPDPPPATVVVTDAARVRQALGNLVSNAIKYTPAGGTVTVVVEPAGEGRRAAIHVRDTGPGIPATLRERVFEEFYRIPDARASAAGTGIGLAISRRVARLLGGDLAVDDAPGGGAAFTLWLPTGGDGARAPTRPGGRAGGRTGGRAGGRSGAPAARPRHR